MAKFCGNCGARMDDAAKICGNCGTPFAGAAPVKYEDPEKKAQNQQKLRKAAIKYGVIGGAMIVVMLVISLIIANTGANGMIKDVVKAFKDYDIDTLVDMSSDVYYYTDADYVEERFESMVGSYHDMFEDHVGHKYKIAHEVIDTYELTSRRMEDVQEEITKWVPDFDVDTIDKITVADVNLRVTEGGKESHWTITIYLSKEDGDWRLLYIQ